MDFGPITLPTIVATLLGIALTGVAAYLRGRTGKARSAAVRLESELREYLREEFDAPTPTQSEVSAADVRVALADAIEGYDPDSDSLVDVRFWDGRHFAPAPGELGLLRTVGRIVSLFPYRPARFDCENFAGFYWTLVPLLFGVNTVGMINDTSAGHAYNVIVDAAGGVHFYDPGGGEFVELGQDEDHLLEHGEITF